jgi:hypothetical protein
MTECGCRLDADEVKGDAASSIDELGARRSSRQPALVAASIPAQPWGQTFHRAIQNKMQWCVSTNIQEEVMRA